jgi:hypothetical protein
MPLKTWNGSSYVAAKTLRVWNGSSWVSAKSGRIWNGSAWVSFFNSTQVNVTDQNIFASSAGYESAFATAEYGLSNLGNAYTRIDTDIGSTQENIPGEWLVNGNAADVSVKATILSQSIGSETYFYGTFDTFLPLSGEYAWGLQSSLGRFDSQDSSGVTFRIDLVLTSNTSTILDTAEITLSVQTQTA